MGETTRRDFLLTTVAGTVLASVLTAPSVAAGQATSQNAPARHVGYVSVRRDNRIAIFTMDPDTGKLTWQEPVPLDGGPDPMAMDPRKRFLHVACRDRQKLVSYRIDPTTGGLSLIGSVPLQGEPIQIVTDRTGRFLLSVFFYQSTIDVHAIGDDGVIAFPPIEWRYTAYGCHGVEVDPSNRFVFVPHVARSGGPNGGGAIQFDCDDRAAHAQRPAVSPSGREPGPTTHAGASNPTRRLFGERAGVQCNGLPPRSVVGDACRFSDHFHGARRLHAAGRSHLLRAAVQSRRPKFLFVVTREHNSITSFAIDPHERPAH